MGNIDKYEDLLAQSQDLLRDMNEFIAQVERNEYRRCEEEKYEYKDLNDYVDDLNNGIIDGVEEINNGDYE